MNIELNHIKKILIIQYKPFGDVLLNTGYLQALRDKFSDARIDFLVQQPYHHILYKNPFLDDLITFPSMDGMGCLNERIKLINLIRKKKYDLIIDQIRGTGSALISLFGGAKYRLGYSKKRFAFIYNIKADKIVRRYSAGMKFDLLKPLGIVEKPYQLFYFIKPESIRYIVAWLEEMKLGKEKIICFSPGSPVPRKQWQLSSYARLADLILEKTKFSVVLLWGPGEKKDVETIAMLMSNNAIVALPTDFNQAAAMIKRSQLLVCNDGGINHLSVAVGTPSLAIFGSTSPVKWGPVNFEGHYVLHNPDVDSRHDKTFGISPEMAFAKVNKILDE